MFSQQESDMLWAIVMLCLRASTLQGGKYVISLLLINDMTPNQLVVVTVSHITNKGAIHKFLFRY